MLSQLAVGRLLTVTVLQPTDLTGSKSPIIRWDVKRTRQADLRLPLKLAAPKLCETNRILNGIRFSYAPHEPRLTFECRIGRNLFSV